MLEASAVIDAVCLVTLQGIQKLSGFQALRDGIYLTLLQALFEGRINIIACIPNNSTVRWVLLIITLL